MVVEVSKINTAAAAFPPRFAFDRDPVRVQARAPSPVIVGVDGKCDVVRSRAVMRRNHTSTRHRLRGQRTTPFEEQEHATRPGIQRLKTLTVPFHRFEAQDITIKSERSLEVVRIENRLHYPIDCGTKCGHSQTIAHPAVILTRKTTMLRFPAARVLLVCLGFHVGLPTIARTGSELVDEALKAEAQLDARRALELFQAAEKAGRTDAFVLQKIARQYSDLMTELSTREEQRIFATQALEYSRRAAAAEPSNAVNVLSVAISLGKLALVSDVADKVRYSRLVREEAERALALDPNYAWAHHILGRWHYEVADLGAASRAAVRFLFGGLPSASAAESVRHLLQAVALEPDELQHHLELGFACLASKNPTRAQEAFARGLAMPSRAKHDEPAKTRARAALAKLSH